MSATTSTRAELVALLREEKVLGEDLLARIEQRSGDAVMPLGVILRQRGKLSMAQLIELSHLQSGNQRLRLGELAVSKGWCTDADIEAALAAQERRVHVLDLVLAEPDLDVAAFARAMVRYAKLIEERMAALEPTV